MTLKQQLNENAALRSRLAASLSKQPHVRRVFMNGGENCNVVTVDVEKAFRDTVSEGQEREIREMRERVHELESIVGANQEAMNTMVQHESEALKTIHSTPVKQVYPVHQQSPIYATPQMRMCKVGLSARMCVSFWRGRGCGSFRAEQNGAV